MCISMTDATPEDLTAIASQFLVEEGLDHPPVPGTPGGAVDDVAVRPHA